MMNLIFRFRRKPWWWMRLMAWHWLWSHSIFKVLRCTYAKQWVLLRHGSRALRWPLPEKKQAYHPCIVREIMLPLELRVILSLPSWPLCTHIREKASTPSITLARMMPNVRGPPLLWWGLSCSMWSQFGKQRCTFKVMHINWLRITEVPITRVCSALRTVHHLGNYTDWYLFSVAGEKREREREIYKHCRRLNQWDHLKKLGGPTGCVLASGLAREEAFSHQLLRISSLPTQV